MHKFDQHNFLRWWVSQRFLGNVALWIHPYLWEDTNCPQIVPEVHSEQWILGSIGLDHSKKKNQKYRVACVEGQGFFNGQAGGYKSPRKWTNVPWKGSILKGNVIFQASIFSGYVRFQGVFPVETVALGGGAPKIHFDIHIANILVKEWAKSLEEFQMFVKMVLGTHSAIVCISEANPEKAAAFENKLIQRSLCMGDLPLSVSLQIVGLTKRGKGGII